jgi:hypothetical protein
MVLQIVFANGATVRSGVEIEDSMVIRMLQCGEVIEAFARSRTREGIPRFQVSDGWISEKLRGGSEDRVVRVLRELLPNPHRYSVVREGGAKVRGTADLDSEDKGMCPEGTTITIVEKRLEVATNGEDTVRMRISEPAEYAGWVSDKPHILRFVEEVPVTVSTGAGGGVAGSGGDASARSAIPQDPEVTAELTRRNQVRLHRSSLKKSVSSVSSKRLVAIDVLSTERRGRAEGPWN